MCVWLTMVFCLRLRCIVENGRGDGARLAHVEGSKISRDLYCHRRGVSSTCMTGATIEHLCRDAEGSNRSDACVLAVDFIAYRVGASHNEWNDCLA